MRITLLFPLLPDGVRWFCILWVALGISATLYYYLVLTLLSKIIQPNLFRFGMFSLGLIPR